MTIPDHESLLPTGAPAEVPGQSHESTLGFVWRFHRSPPGRGGPGLAHSQGCAALHPGLLSAGPSGTEADSEPNESDLGMKVLGIRFMRLPCGAVSFSAMRRKMGVNYRVGTVIPMGCSGITNHGCTRRSATSAPSSSSNAGKKQRRRSPHEDLRRYGQVVEMTVPPPRRPRG